MRIKIFFILGLLFLLYFVPSAFSQAAISTPFETVELEAISYYRYYDLGFTGMDMLIRDKKIWAYFWAQHTAGITPPPPLPEIKFAKEMVAVTILGYQTSGGGPSTKVLAVNTDGESKCLHVLVEDNEIPGPLCVITNPFHIIKLKKINADSVVFEHQKAPETTLSVTDNNTPAK